MFRSHSWDLIRSSRLAMSADAIHPRRMPMKNRRSKGTRHVSPDARCCLVLVWLAYSADCVRILISINPPRSTEDRDTRDQEANVTLVDSGLPTRCGHGRRAALIDARRTSSCEPAMANRLRLKHRNPKAGKI